MGGIVNKFIDTTMTGVRILFFIPVGLALLLASPLFVVLWLIGKLGEKVGLGN